MSLSDPIADMLTRIRNAHAAGHEVVEMPHSRVKADIALVLKREGFVKDFVVDGGQKRILRVFLRYTEDLEPMIHGLRRDSKPGRRRYVGSGDIPRVLGGLGIGVVSTSAGIMTDKEARQKHVGGELICSIW